MRMSFRRQFLPPLIGILTMLVILGGSNAPFLWSRVFYYIQGPTISAEAALTSQSPSTEYITKPNPSKPSRIIIEKINISVPIVYSEKEINEKSFQMALRDGVVHYPQTSLPGAGGNTVIFGHSSGAVWRPGNYKQAFSLLDKISNGDLITIEYQGITYKYQVKNTHVVLPTEVSVLQPTTAPRLTLITCYPIGTNDKRLIVEAEQLTPSDTTKTFNHKEAPSVKRLPSPDLYLLPTTKAPWEN